MSNKRSQARHFAVQALYQWQMAGQDLMDIYNQFMEQESTEPFDKGYFKGLLYGVPQNLSVIDEALRTGLDRAIEGVDPVERAVVRMAVYELMFHPEVPYRVVINESVELAKRFGAEQSHKFINGVLDKVAREQRKPEVVARRSGGRQNSSSDMKDEIA